MLAGLGTEARAAVGATTPFVTLEAEAGTRGGGAIIRSTTPGMPVPAVATLELEASGHSLVELRNNGDSVSWVNNTGVTANAIVIRASIPDAPNGGGITATINLYVDGVFRQVITLSSKQSWVYRGSLTNPDDPNGGGMPYHFYNEDRVRIAGAPIAAGSAIKLQRDPANTAAVYDIDCIDLENVPVALTQPANSLSIVAYGADPNFTTDSTVAIQNCVNDARAQGKSVWIPPGKYMTNSLASGGLNFTGVTVNGAGMWYSMIYRQVPLPPPVTPWRSNITVGSGTTLRDISIDSNAIYRGVGGAGGDDSGISANGAGGWLIERVWVQHCDAQWLSGSNGIIRDSRVADSWADGINLNNGNTPNPDKVGLNLTVQNCFVRGGGDDGIATYSDAGANADNSQMDGTKILNNTSVAAWWANGIRIAGGKNVQVSNNLVNGVAANNAMEVGVFGDTGQPLESATVDGNVLIGGGGWNGTDRHGVHVGSLGSASFFPNAYTVATISNNTIRDSLRAGLKIGATYENVTVSNNTIDRPANQGIWIASGVTGTGTFSRNTVSNLLAGQTPFQNDSPSTFTTTLTGNSWQVSPPPAPTGLTATAGSGQISLSWTASPGATSYNVKRATVSGGPYTTIATAVTVTSYTDTGLTNGTTYYEVVSAVNSVGESANSAPASATPSTGGGTLPTAPTGLSVTDDNNHAALSWGASTGATSYRVKRATVNGGPYTVIASPTTNSYTDTAVVAGTTYYYVVSAVNSVGESPNSAQVSYSPGQ